MKKVDSILDKIGIIHKEIFAILIFLEYPSYNMGNSQSSNFSTSLNEKGNDFLETFSKKRKLEEVKSSLSQINHSFTDPRTPVWLDSDVGHDDSFAIILAGHSPKLNLLGISTVHGNQTVENTTLNTLKIVSISGLQHIGL